MSEPTETLETISRPIWARKGGLHAMIETMQQSGFHSWGFVIYRGTYSDDDAWERYMAVLRHRVQKSLEAAGEERLLPQYLRYTVIEDPALEGASKTEIRTRFQQWVAEGSTEREGPGFDHVVAQGFRVPRFSYCLYVDQRCLNTLPAWETWRDAGYADADPKDYSTPLEPLVACMLVDKDCAVAGKGETGHPNVEGCVRYYTGWMFMCMHAIPSRYNALSSDGVAARNDLDYWYCRPPLCAPGNDHGETVPP